jgi:hypothetical protein
MGLARFSQALHQRQFVKASSRTGRRTRLGLRTRLRPAQAGRQRRTPVERILILPPYCPHIVVHCPGPSQRHPSPCPLPGRGEGRVRGERRSFFGFADQSDRSWQCQDRTHKHRRAPKVTVTRSGEKEWALNNWQEWRAHTSSIDPASMLRMISVSGNPVSGLSIKWQSSDVFYCLERSTNLSSVPAFVPLWSNIIGQSVSTAVVDTAAPNTGSVFYRVMVQQMRSYPAVVAVVAT